MSLVGHPGSRRRWIVVAATVIVGSSLPLLEATPAWAQVAPGDHVLLAAGDIAKCDSPGDEATYHQPNEEIEVEQLVTFAGRLANLALEIGNETQG